MTGAGRLRTKGGLELAALQKSLPPLGLRRMGARIDIFCDEADSADRICETLRERSLVTAGPALHMGGVAAAAAIYADTPSPDLLLVESCLDAQGLLNALEALSEVCEVGTRLIVIGHVNDVTLYRELKRRGVCDYLVAPVDPGELSASIDAAMKSDTGDGPGRIAAFIGAKGGCGSSSVCHNTGWVLAETLKTETVIADFDLDFGTLGLDFNQDGGEGLKEALAASDKLDGHMMGKLLARCSERLALLTASCVLDATTCIDPESAFQVVRLMSERASFTILDLPREWTHWTCALIELADELVITAEPDLANLRNAKSLIDAMHSVRGSAKPPLLVLNKIGMPRRPEISVADFANALDLEPAVCIGFDAQLYGSAANNGLMIGEIDAKAEPLARLRTLAERLSGKAPAQRSAAGLLKPMIGLLKQRFTM